MPITTPKFEESYNKLNPEQKMAVDTIEGPVMVVAGPGTGKTQILTLRIANILRLTDVGPRGILALTFTEAAASSMRQRLADIIGLPAYDVTITTFHAFCNSIIQDYPESFPEIIGSQPITEVDQINIIEQNLKTLPLTILRPKGDPLWYTRPALSAIGTLKREGVTPDQFKTILEKGRLDFEAIEDLYHEKGKYKGIMKGTYQTELKTIEKNTELLSLYRGYETSLHLEKIYDYNDMILKVRDCLNTNQELLLNLQEKYQYILVDEHQDTNKAQNNILELLANFYDQPNLFVVGDEKQAIYRFQGASPENFKYFKTRYSDTKIITLTTNYRSRQAILDAAYGLHPQSTTLAGIPNTDNHIRLLQYTTREQETVASTQTIVEQIQNGIAPSDIAVIYRDNADALDISRELKKKSIAFQIRSDQNLFDEPIVKKILLLLSAIQKYGSDELLAQALHIDFLDLQPLDIFKALTAAREKRVSLYDFILTEKYNQLTAVISRLSDWNIQNQNGHLLDVVSDIIRDSGCLTYALKQPNQFELTAALKKFFDIVRQRIIIKPTLTLVEFLAYIETITNHGIKIKKPQSPIDNAVQLMTAHRAKGLEFESVFILHCFDGHWGGKRHAQAIKLPRRISSLFDETTTEDYDDECNVFYVALTRAKNILTVSYAVNDGERELLPSRYLGALGHTAESIDYPLEPTGIFAAIQPKIPSRESINSFVKQIFLKQGFSVTALNNYLECPWRYFYENLLQIPRTPSIRQRYGTAIHKALNDFFIDGKATDKPTLINAFENAIKQQPLSESEYTSLTEEGRITLNAYYQNYLINWQGPVMTEFKVPTIQLTDNIKIRGMIDRIDLLEKGERTTFRGPVHVVDYKTGKSKSRNVIEGTTASSDGNYKRQLVFYNLLLNHYDNGRLDMQSGEIDFVEPDEKGKFKKEKFTVTAEEIKNLESVIASTASEILSLAFWDRRCDNKECAYCGLRDLMADS